MTKHDGGGLCSDEEGHWWLWAATIIVVAIAATCVLAWKEASEREAKIAPLYSQAEDCAREGGIPIQDVLLRVCCITPTRPSWHCSGRSDLKKEAGR